jgi:hypothetical protein
MNTVHLSSTGQKQGTSKHDDLMPIADEPLVYINCTDQTTAQFTQINTALAEYPEFARR